MAKSLSSLTARALAPVRLSQLYLRTTHSSLALVPRKNYTLARKTLEHSGFSALNVQDPATTTSCFEDHHSVLEKTVLKLVDRESWCRNDDIIIRDSYSTCNILNKVGNLEPGFSLDQRDAMLLSMSQQHLLNNTRREWLRYNLAMSKCKDEIFLCEAGKTKPGLDENGDHAKLYEVKEYLADHLRQFFVKMHNYSLYSKDVILENNYYEPSRTYRSSRNLAEVLHISQHLLGISSYALQLNKIRWLASFRYTHAKFQILKITANEADNTIRVRWRITGLSNAAAFLRFWKFIPGRYQSSLESESDWHDGYSTFYLGKDGYIFKHIVDKVIPDDEVAVDKKRGLAAKLTMTLGFISGPLFGD